MRCFILLLIFFGSLWNAKAQDTLVKKDGGIIIGKVIEVGTSDLKYKRMDSPDGPVYVIHKWDLQYIIYSNGRKELYSDITPPSPLPVTENLSILVSGSYYYYKEHRIMEADMLAIAKQRQDKKIDLMIKKTQDKKFIQEAFVIGGIGLGVAGLYEMAANGRRRGGRRGGPAGTATSTTAVQNGEYILLTGAGCELAAIYFKIDRTRHAHIVADAYNKSLSH